MTTPTTEDLREALRSSSDAMPPGLDVIGGVERRRQQQRRRRWGALGGVALATCGVVVAAVAMSGQPTQRATPVVGPTPSPSPTAAALLPEYVDGGHLIASRDVVDPHGLMLTFTPTTRHIGFRYSCINDGLKDRLSSHSLSTLTLSGTTLYRDSCGGITSESMGRDNWRLYGAVPGQPMTVSLHFPPGVRHAGTRFVVGVYERVPVADYPFPPRPEKLEPLFAPMVTQAGFGEPVVFPPRRPENVPVDCCSTTRQWYHGITVVAESVAPAHLVMYVDDRPVWDGWSWDYTADLSQASFSLDELGLRPGQRATVRFTTTGPPDAATYALYDSAGH